MNIIVETTGGYASSFNGRIEIPNKTIETLADITRDILLNISHNKENFGDLIISIPSVYHAEMIMGCVVILITSSGMEQYLQTNKLKCGV